MISVAGFTNHVLLICPIMWELVIISHFHKSYIGKVLLFFLLYYFIWDYVRIVCCLETESTLNKKKHLHCWYLFIHAFPYSIVFLIFPCCTNPSFDLILLMQLCSHESLSKGSTFLEMCPWVNQLLCEDCRESWIECIDGLSRGPLFCLWL